MMTEKLKKLFSPDSVAVVGASNNFDKLGYHVMKSLVGHYAGALYPINPRGGNIWNLDSFSSLSDVPGDIDLAILVVPAALVPETLHQCGEKGVKGVVIITAGFREIEDSQGEILQENIRKICEHYDLPVIGPNTLGFVNITSGINATFNFELCNIEKGGVTLLSQSGGMSHLFSCLAAENRVGMSALVSLGNRLNIGFPEAVRFFLEQDEATKVIAIYLEGMDEPRTLLDTARSFRGKKPIVVYKSGKSAKGDSASKFHTGSLAGNHEIWKGAFRQAGILEVASSEELVDTAKALCFCPPARGTRIAVLAAQAGPGMVTADSLETCGLSLARFSSATQKKINEFLPPIAIRTNPIDMGPAWFNQNAMLEILYALVDDEGTDGVIFLNFYGSANHGLASSMEKYLRDNKAFIKPVISVLTAPPVVWDESVKRFDGTKGIITLPTPERAAKAMSNLWKANLLSAREG